MSNPFTDRERQFEEYLRDGITAQNPDSISWQSLY